jgi:hypothetical protein
MFLLKQEITQNYAAFNLWGKEDVKIPSKFYEIQNAHEKLAPFSKRVPKISPTKSPFFCCDKSYPMDRLISALNQGPYIWSK